MNVAIVHDWLVTYRGGEKVLEAIAKLFPGAPIYTLFCDRAALPETLRRRRIIVPPLLNAFRPIRKLLLPWLPAAVEALPLMNFDLIISTSSCVAKGVIPGPGAKHVCYIHSPMRYIWDQQDSYMQALRRVPAGPALFSILAARLRLWDVVSAARVDHFIANSHFVAKRVSRFYGRDSSVIHPPIPVQAIQEAHGAAQRGDYYVAAGALVNYKRFDLAIRACQALGRRLIVAGSGPEERALRALAGATTEIIVNPSTPQLMGLLAGAKALLFPGVEDFGMVAIEALACGTPLIALGKGGAMDFLRQGVNGVAFAEPTVQDLREAIATFETKTFSREQVAATAQAFDERAFAESFMAQINSVMGQ